MTNAIADTLERAGVDPLTSQRLATRVLELVHKEAGRVCEDLPAEAAGAGYLRKHLRVLLSIFDQESCECIDPPQDRCKDDERGNDPDDPAAHAQYCPVYLAEYVRNLVVGKEEPDPDSWPTRADEAADKKC